MKLKIDSIPWTDVKFNKDIEQYKAVIYDGPDYIDYAEFTCSTLTECIEQVNKWRALVARSYVTEA